MVPGPASLVLHITNAEGDVIAHGEFTLRLVAPPPPPSEETLRRAEMMRAVAAAYATLDAEEWDAARAQFLALTRSYESFGDPYYHMACFYSRWGSRTLEGDLREAAMNRALTYLGMAIEHGWTNTAHMANDPDMEPLRDREQYEALLARMQPQDDAEE